MHPDAKLADGDFQRRRAALGRFWTSSQPPEVHEDPSDRDPELRRLAPYFCTPMRISTSGATIMSPL
jgi:hypothetical protein